MNQQITFKVSVEQKNLIDVYAKKLGLSQASCCRLLVLRAIKTREIESEKPANT